MADHHWSNEQLLAKLYGIEPGDGHLEECSECLRRWEEISSRRRKLLENHPVISTERLAKQRYAILRRIALARRPLRIAGFVPALAVLSVLVIVLALFYQKLRPPVTAETGDNAVFEEVFTLASGEEPEAVQPIQALFEGQP